MQPAHQHADEGGVEQPARAQAQALEHLGRERDRRRRFGDDDVGAVDAQLGVRRQVGHLAHRRAGAELRHALAAAVHLHLALGDDVEGVTFLPLAVQRVAEGAALPVRPVHHLPQLDIAEAGEELQRTQQVEALRIEHRLQRAARHVAIGDQRGQVLREAVPVGIAILAALAQRAGDQPVQLGRHTVAQQLQRGRRGVVDLVHQRRLLRGVERRPPGDQVVQHAGQRIDVGTGVEHVAVQLLGRHVGQRAHAEHLRALRLQVHDAAEVADLDVDHLVVSQGGQDVGRFHVAVDQALAIDIAQRHRTLEADLDHLLQRQQRVGAAEAAQRRAVDVFHDEIRRIAVVHRVMDLHHVRMLQPPHQRRLGREEVLLEVPFGRVLGGAATHALDGHLALVEFVPGQEHLAGRAFSQPGAHGVLADLCRPGGGGGGLNGHLRIGRQHAHRRWCQPRRAGGRRRWRHPSHCDGARAGQP